MRKLLLITTALVAGADPAHAAPVAAAAAWVGGVLAGGGVAAFAMNMALSVGLSVLSQALLKPKTPEVSVSFDVQMGDTLPLSFVVGDYATAGQRKYIESWGRNTRFITEVIEVSALPQGFAALWVNDEPGNLIAGQRAYVSASASPSSVSQPSQGASVPAGSLDVGQPLDNWRNPDARIWVKWVNGTQAVADPFLVWAFGSRTEYPWTSAMIGRGKTYAIVTTRHDDSLNGYPTFLFQPAPLALYDLRFDSTAGGSGSQRWSDPATWQPTLNPAVIAYNVARGIYYGSEWVFGGKNLPAWRLPQAEWLAAANACSAAQARAGGGVEARYRCGMEIKADMEPASVLEEIGKSANMKFPEVGGRLKPVVDLPGTAVFSFTDGDVLVTQGQSFEPFYPVAETYNAISATYPERAEKWTTKDAPLYIDAAATADDDGRYLPVGLSYPAVPFAGQVQRLQRSAIRDYRRMRRHQFYLPPDAYALEPGIDLVSYTSDRNGYISKQFMVERVAKTPGMNVLVSLREVDPSDYDWSSDFELPITLTPPVNPLPFVQPINGLIVDGEIVYDAANNARRSSIFAACEGDEVGVTHIAIERRITGLTEIVIEPLRPFVAPFKWHMLDVIQGQFYDVRARLISDRTPFSEWSDWITAQAPVVGYGWDDLTGEVREDVEALETWATGTGDDIRGLLDELDLVRDGMLEGDFQAFTEREALRAQITALDVRIDTAHAGAIQALVTRIADTEAGLSAQSDAITLVEARTDRGTAEGLLRVSAESGPAGVQSRIGLRAEASDADVSHSAAFYLEASTDGTSQAGVVADRFWVASATVVGAERQIPFILDNGVAYFNALMVQKASIETLHLAGQTVIHPFSVVVSDTIVVQAVAFATITGLDPGETIPIHVSAGTIVGDAMGAARSWLEYSLDIGATWTVLGYDHPNQYVGAMFMAGNGHVRVRVRITDHTIATDRRISIMCLGVKR